MLHGGQASHPTTHLVPRATFQEGGGQDTKGAWSWGPQHLKCTHLTWTLRKGSTPLLLLCIPFLWKPVKVKTFYQSRKPLSISEHIIACIKTSVTTSSHQTWIQTRFSVKYQRLLDKQNSNKRLIPNPDPAKTQNKVLELVVFFFFFPPSTQQSFVAQFWSFLIGLLKPAYRAIAILHKIQHNWRKIPKLTKEPWLPPQWTSVSLKEFRSR